VNVGARLYNRDFSARWGPLPAAIAPVRYSHTAVGGPEQAELEATGSPASLWECIEWLRCPLSLYDDYAQLVWWGYVSEVEVTAGAFTVGVSLGETYNRIKVGYIRDTDSTRQLTDWVSDSASIATYGTLEYLGGMSSASDGLAAEDGDKILAAHRYPLTVVSTEGGDNGLRARLTCRGWYDTLDWRFYSNSATAGTAATTIIGDVISSHSQFITGTDIVDAGTITRSQYYDLGQTCRQVIDDLLAVGVDGGNRLLATVDSNRRLRVYQEPSKGSNDYLLRSDGRLSQGWGMSVQPHTCPVANWVRLVDVIPASADTSRLADPSYFFVERAEYDCRTGRLRLEPRGRRGPWQVVEVEE
jgi:hypothetical protein